MQRLIVAATRVLKSAADQWLCLLIGHDGFREILKGELCVRCRRCWHRSDGWQLDGRHPVTGKVLAYSSSWPRTVVPGRVRDFLYVKADTGYGVPAEGVALAGFLDDPTARLAADLSAEGKDDLVQLLLRPAGRVVH